MLLSGLLSVTFRRLHPDKIIDLVQRASLSGIEWGGDIHIPHGDLKRAQETRRRTENAGLQIFAYGSYYRSVASEEEGLSFNTILETAIALGAPIIRIWAGRRGSAEVDRKYRTLIAENIRAIGNTTQAQNIQVVLEFHSNTLTDSADSALCLIREVAHPNIKLSWQPPHAESTGIRLEGLKKILPYLLNLHVFHWKSGNGKLDRRPLNEGVDDWTTYLKVVNSPFRQCAAMLEFVRGDSPDQFLQDADTLRQLIENVSTGSAQ
ncbi:MAG: 3-dehydroshikimate dehydratase [Candidatus Moanabacter tarae]|uniref:3-dehydroshikimate dehydratase n=1 Tax=Candidatus Moanibacter tarae TaxID=2200854 RepID=A0A2Z4AHF0_9BACT|nr:MAG: 3-dehydroshikimate dehydratase [Candidatus Moanabacter tarae]|tara:strand:+ start:58967 stop:59758 length:792 start_codon:yes stop_codon:yes gene_type:complete